MAIPSRTGTTVIDPPLNPGARSHARGIGATGYFTLAVGAIVGSAWVIVLGDWLAAAGPGGAAVGFALGGLAMVAIGLCYAELAARRPQVGGEFLYTLHMFGRLPAFLVGWCLTLFAVSICAFEAVAVAALVGMLVPAASGPIAYPVGNSAVHIGNLIIGLVGAAGIGVLQYAGVASAIRFQNVATLLFLVVLGGLVLLGFALGSSANWSPAFEPTTNHGLLAGILWVFSSCALFLNGWQTALHAIEERRPGVSIRTAVTAMLAGIAVGALAYCAIILSASASAPWRSLLLADLPAVVAFSALPPHGVLGTIVVVVSIVSALKTWNALAWVGTRLIIAQAREGFLPARFAHVHEASRSPRVAVVAVTLLSVLGPILGRASILPIVDMTSICLAFSIIVCLAALLRERRMNQQRPSFMVPGGVATILTALLAACLMIGVAIIEPLVKARGNVPIEWKLIGVWLCAGLLVFWLTTRRVQLAAP